MRRVFAVLVAVGIAVWLAAPALPARPFVPRVVEFEQVLPTPGARGATGWRSGVVRAPKRFDLVGLTWRAPHELRARIRVRSASGRWSAWTAMGDDHAGGSGAEPVWAGGAEVYEVRLSRRPRRLQAHFVNATGTATAAARLTTGLRRAVHGALAALAGTAARAQGAQGAPAIIPREAGGADQCPPRAAPEYGEVKLGVVHHTVDANDYGPQDGAAIVLAICRYHRNTNGWRDIGYNFLVDRYGQIFEGRAGGIDQPVVGAQAQGYNSISTGVADIGTFTDAAQAPEAVHATAQLLAWKLSLHGAPVTGRVTVTSAGGPANRYPAGRAATVERISGHPDFDTTACPGDALFAQLPEIRRQAAQLAPTVAAPTPTPSALTIGVADPTLDVPQAAQLSGRATGRRAAPRGRADLGPGRGGVRLPHARPHGDGPGRDVVARPALAVHPHAARGRAAARRRRGDLAARRGAGRAADPAAGRAARGRAAVVHHQRQRATADGSAGAADRARGQRAAHARRRARAGRGAPRALLRPHPAAAPCAAPPARDVGAQPAQRARALGRRRPARRAGTPLTRAARLYIAPPCGAFRPPMTSRRTTAARPSFGCAPSSRTRRRSTASSSCHPCERAVLGLETYDAVVRRHGDVLQTLNNVFLGISSWSSRSG
jgi:hypothetical protein